MSAHTVIDPGEASDRVAIRELIDAYANFADRRRPEDQAALYAEDGRTLVYIGDPAASEPAQVLVGLGDHVDGFKTLDQYVATMHFNGQSTITVDGDHATADTYCLAHHLSEDGTGRSLLIMSIRYADSLIKTNGAWLFAERRLVIDWTDRRPSMP